MLKNLPLAWCCLMVCGLIVLPHSALRADEDDRKAFDKRFVKEAAEYSRAENDISRLAREQSHSEGVKHYAELMIGGHKKLLNELQEIAQTHHYTLPDELTGKQKDVLEKLRKLHDTDFDVQYMGEQVEDQQALVELFDKASKECVDDNLREFAARKLPMLREHLENARELYKKVKNKER